MLIDDSIDWVVHSLVFHQKSILVVSLSLLSVAIYGIKVKI
jgi:hypothetical protein